MGAHHCHQRRSTGTDQDHPEEKAALKFVLATMIRTADRWCRMSISDLERHQLALLRTELGLDSPPANPNHC
jgi:putative transposase